jgi:Flp pilus assembly secretin CpaC
VSLRITPQIERNGAVRSRIEVEVSAVDNSLPAPNGPALKTRRAATEFNVRSGQTLVLAGFLSREETRNVEKFPGLAEVPVLGQLFKSRRYQRSETELAILVTPVVVAHDHPDLVQRVDKAQAILHSHFPEEEVINTPVRARSAPVDPGSDELGALWVPWSGSGSQWSDSDPNLPRAAPAYVDATGNERHFKE